MNNHDLALTLARRMHSLPSSCVRELMRSSEGQGTISFAGGLPRPDLLPLAAVQAATDCVLAHDGGRALQYSSTEGDIGLRAQIAEGLLARRGMRVSPEQVLITSGSQQGLDLLGKVMLDPGARVALESPSYLAAIQAFALHEPEYLSVAMDEQGAIPEELAEGGEGRPVRFFYAIPDFQNPTGRVYSRPRRAAVVEALDRRGLPLVEDAPYSFLHYGDDPGPMMAAAYPERSLVMGTVSKILAPGFRVGWVAGPKAWIEQLTRAKQASDLCTGAFVQRIVAELLQSLDLNEHLGRLRAAYRAQRDAMLAALARHMPPGVSWRRPAGGMFLWLTLPIYIPAREVLARCVPRGVVFAPGDAFSPTGRHGNAMRLNFTHASEADIGRGIAILGEEVAALL
ncbi:MAG: PLP-dependent aminotransferase family protein [Victivallales bacterium]|nr:PLP-dependent aminotransferase family protein [Victivallales bacterium]